MRILLIDDIREFGLQVIPPKLLIGEPAHELVVARTFEEGIAKLKEGSWDILYLDHDLGTEEYGKDGYGVMKFIEEFPQYLPKDICFVTSNPVGRKNMALVYLKLLGESL